MAPLFACFFSYPQGDWITWVLNHIGMTHFQMWARDVEYIRWLVQGKYPLPSLPYSATKFALDGFFSSLSHELMMQKKNVSITVCILSDWGKVHPTASPAPEAALTIIQGGATWMWEVFYPWWPLHMR
ncbi:hydroxysteroid 11-beta-dehydrogenase 1-like protein [Tyto alba]|uniref:hydroxysteroid 11-beta-dehydrogenase 1-like protein n=1 Tax=Tyto alba TaxID=56313 RepID=UPI001C6687DA|nr:hydroxysteroid 11-beta-dehydrogenase 1-like protein [Tyto alba]